jgi:hypothetical protein
MTASPSKVALKADHLKECRAEIGAAEVRALKLDIP